MSQELKAAEIFLRARQLLVDFLYDLDCISEDTWNHNNELHEVAKWEAMSDREKDRFIRGHL